MATDTGSDVPEDAGEPEGPGREQGAHGDVEQWLRRNLEDGERGPAHAEGEEATDTMHSTSESHHDGEGNLVQPPVGATFGLDHEPTPQERDELVRFAAEADRELHGDGPGRQVDDTGA